MQAAAPSIHVGAMYEYAEPGKGALLKRVRNTGDATAFVRVQISEVRYAVDGSHHEVPVSGTDAGLVASPSRLIRARVGCLETSPFFGAAA